MRKIALGIAACLAFASASAGVLTINYNTDPPTARTYSGAIISVDQDRASLAFRSSAPGQWSGDPSISRATFDGATMWHWLVSLDAGVPGAWETASGYCVASVADQDVTLDCSQP